MGGVPAWAETTKRTTSSDDESEEDEDDLLQRTGNSYPHQLHQEES